MTEAAVGYHSLVLWAQLAAALMTEEPGPEWTFRLEYNNSSVLGRFEDATWLAESCCYGAIQETKFCSRFTQVFEQGETQRLEQNSNFLGTSAARYGKKLKAILPGHEFIPLWVRLVPHRPFHPQLGLERAIQDVSAFGKPSCRRKMLKIACVFGIDMIHWVGGDRVGGAQEGGPLKSRSQSGQSVREARA